MPHHSPYASTTYRFSVSVSSIPSGLKPFFPPFPPPPKPRSSLATSCHRAPRPRSTAAPAPTPMASPSRQAVPLRLLLLLLLLAAVAAALVGSATAGAELTTTALHARMAAEWAWSAASDDDSCWGSPEECPVVVHDVGAGAAARARLRLQETSYYDADTAATLLPTAEYISYGALMRDSVPCSIPGASYYNCQPGAEANPYTRGCSEITQCRG